MSFNTGTTADSGTSQTTSQQITVPAGVLTGDKVYVFASCVNVTSGTPVTFSISSTGTTPVTSSGTNNPITGTESLPAAVTGQLWEFTAGASDPGATITITSSAAGLWAAALGAWTGGGATDVLQGAFGGANSSSVTCPTLSTGISGDWAIYFGGGAAEGGGIFGPTTPGSPVQRESDITADDVAAAIYDSNGSVGGSSTSIGGGTFTTATATNSIMVAFTVGMAPATVTVVLSPGALGWAVAGQAYSETITASGGTGPYTFAVTSGSLPGWASLSSGGVLSGTPSTTGGPTSFTITATDSLSNTGTQAYSLTVGTNAEGTGFGVKSMRTDRHYIDGNLGTSATSPAATDAGQWLAFLPASGGGESGPFAITIPSPTTSLTGVITHQGGFNITLPAPKTTITGADVHKGPLTLTLPAPFTTISGKDVHDGPLNITIPIPTFSLSGKDVPDGAFAITIPSPKTTISGTVTHQGAFNITIPAPHTSLTGVVTHQGAFNITLPAPKTTISGTVTHQGPLNLTLPAPHTSLTGVVVHKGAFNITLPAPSTSLTGADFHGEAGPFNPVIPAPKTTLTGVITHKGAFTPVIPAPKTVIAGADGHLGGFNITLPVVKLVMNLGEVGHVGPLAVPLLTPRTSITGNLGHNGPLVLTLPAPVTSINGSQTGPGVSGTFAIHLLIPTTSILSEAGSPYPPDPFFVYGWTDQELVTTIPGYR